MKTVLVLALFLVACGASATKVAGPDGKGTWYAVSCRRSQSNCYEKAGEVCPNGYHVADASDHEGVYVSAGGFTGTQVTPTYNGEMMIKCKE